MAPKKKWKRIDVSSVQESLFESNIAQNVAKGGLSEAMVIDTIGEAPSRRLAKKIKSQRHGDPIASRGTVERARLQKLVSRLKSERARMDIEENAPQGNERVIDDIWGDNAEPAAMLRPSMPTLAKVIPAVAAPHSGQSYNPSPEAREELINKAYESLPQEEDFSDEPLTDMIRECLPNVDVDNLTFRQKQVLGNLIIQDKLDESSIMEALAAADQEEVSEEEMDNTATANKRRVTTKKTRAKRNREKLHKASIAQALMRKRIKRLVHDIDHFKDTKHENDPLEIEEAKKERLRKYLQDLVKGRITPKFGNKVYRVDPPEVPLSDEVTSSLRQLASPSEASVRCVVDSIYRRGLVPAPPVIDEQYRSKARSKLLRRTRKFKSKLLHASSIALVTMFHFYVVEDLISLEVGEYLSDARSHLSAKVSDKYVDKVIGGVGLVVLVDDILVQSEPKIMPNDACAMFTLRLRILVFAPGRDELLRGIVTSSDVTGISVSLGFFNDIKLIPLFMPPVSAFDADSSQWYTEVDGNRLYYKHQSEISFRVVDISYNELNDLSGDEHLPVMLIIGAPVETV